MGILAREDDSLGKKNIESCKKESNNVVKIYPDLYEYFDEAFIAVDWDLVVIHWNKAAERVTTVKAKDALGKKIYGVLPEMVTVDFSQYLTLLQQRRRARFMMNVTSQRNIKAICV